MSRSVWFALGCMVTGLLTAFIGRDPTIWFASVIIISALAGD